MRIIIDRRWWLGDCVHVGASRGRWFLDGDLVCPVSQLSFAHTFTWFDARTKRPQKEAQTNCKL